MSDRTALDTLRYCADAFRRDLAPAERARILALHASALQALEQAQLRPSTRAQLARVRRLKRQLAHMPSGDQIAAICERMGLGKSRVYELLTLLGNSGDNTGKIGGLIPLVTQRS